MTGPRRGSGEGGAGAGIPARTAGARPGQWVAGSVVYGPVTQVSGVVGDVHVTANTGAERALYRVDAFPKEHAAPTVAQARAQPARLLQARYALIDFTGRGAELARLTAWRDGPGAVSVLLVHGAGGQGKTRLAARFAAHTRERSGG
ncbi:hypothetical protein B4N89_46790 [Embleya scabrispora]|uniref:Orc1-like AAA ATPase domain-containing protein n=1 Tax=Embleya scabrispora TaxID=159449 RepID=A0A1T3NII6_9ACTN|nr:ATP-binding protein [Embleya scabrispora]OPC76525.1 hypothetical protein B4N89_46790 [Embleya scabrispora]